MHDDAFYGCKALEDVTLPTTLLELGDEAERYDGGKPRYRSHFGLFQKCSIVHIDLPAGLKHLGCKPFYSCKGN